MPNEYHVEWEIEGDYALFTRPDTGDVRVSYEVPTYSAVVGLTKQILRLPDSDGQDLVQIIPKKVHICKPIQFYHMNTNNYGPIRKPDQFKKGGAYQTRSTILWKVCYQFCIQIANVNYKKINYAHAYFDIFNRRLNRNQSHSTPFLGCREFGPTYVGLLRPETQPCKYVNLMLPGMFKQFTSYDFQDNNKEWMTGKVENGVMYYD